MLEHYFSKHYRQARERFLNAASKAGAQVDSYPVNCNSVLNTTIDVAILGKENHQTIVISSGVHGVEGFFGSAVQLALLEGFIEGTIRPNIRYVLIHAVNPCGFASVSRVNENNVDLNRNFLLTTQSYTGAPSGYADLNTFLNPQTVPSKFELFRLKALWSIGRHGMPSLKQSIAAGQYEYPQGLFYGGREPSQSMCIVRDHCDSWLSEAEKIIHIDLHTGLGVSGAYKLLLGGSLHAAILPWYMVSFGKDNVEAKADSNGTAYTVTGSFGEWLGEYFGPQKYRFLTAEFGTHNIVRVLRALRADNQARVNCSNDQSVPVWVKKEMMECFCPENLSWRRGVLQSGLNIVEQGVEALEKAW